MFRRSCIAAHAIQWKPDSRAHIKRSQSAAMPRPKRTNAQRENCGKWAGRQRLTIVDALASSHRVRLPSIRTPVRWCFSADRWGTVDRCSCLDSLCCRIGFCATVAYATPYPPMPILFVWAAFRVMYALCICLWIDVAVRHCDCAWFVPISCRLFDYLAGNLGISTILALYCLAERNVVEDTISSACHDLRWMRSMCVIERTQYVSTHKSLNVSHVVSVDSAWHFNLLGIQHKIYTTNKRASKHSAR